MEVTFKGVLSHPSDKILGLTYHFIFASYMQGVKIHVTTDDVQLNPEEHHQHCCTIHRCYRPTETCAGKI